MIYLIIVLIIAGLVAWLLREPAQICTWCRQRKSHTIAWRGGHVCTDCAEKYSAPVDLIRPRRRW